MSAARGKKLSKSASVPVPLPWAVRRGGGGTNFKTATIVRPFPCRPTSNHPPRRPPPFLFCRRLTGSARYGSRPIQRCMRGIRSRSTPISLSLHSTNRACVIAWQRERERTAGLGDSRVQGKFSGGDMPQDARHSGGDRRPVVSASMNPPPRGIGPQGTPSSTGPHMTPQSLRVRRGHRGTLSCNCARRRAMVYRTPLRKTLQT